MPEGEQGGITGYAGLAEAGLLEGTLLGKVYVMVHRSPLADEGIDEWQGEYGEWWGYLEFLSGLAEEAHHHIQAGNPIVITRRSDAYGGLPLEGIRLAVVLRGYHASSDRYLVVEDTSAE